MLLSLWKVSEGIYESRINYTIKTCKCINKSSSAYPKFECFYPPNCLWLVRPLGEKLLMTRCYSDRGMSQPILKRLCFISREHVVIVNIIAFRNRHSSPFKPFTTEFRYCEKKSFFLRYLPSFAVVIAPQFHLSVICSGNQQRHCRVKRHPIHTWISYNSIPNKTFGHTQVFRDRKNERLSQWWSCNEMQRNDSH